MSDLAARFPIDVWCPCTHRRIQRARRPQINLIYAEICTATEHPVANFNRRNCVSYQPGRPMLLRTRLSQPLAHVSRCIFHGKISSHNQLLRYEANWYEWERNTFLIIPWNNGIIQINHFLSWFISRFVWNEIVIYNILYIDFFKFIYLFIYFFFMWHRKWWVMWYISEWSFASFLVGTINCIHYTFTMMRF